MSEFTTIIRPDVTEKGINIIEKENKLVFLVDRRAGKRKIKGAIEKIYSVKISDINTQITPRGTKKAYVKLAKEYKASEIATRIGIL